MRKAVLFVCHQGVLLLAFILLLGGCTSSTIAQQTPLPSAQAATRPTATPYYLPTPVTGLLDPIPSDCQPTLPAETRTYEQFGAFLVPVTLHGGGQAWLVGNITVLHLNQYGPQLLPGTKVFWVTGPIRPKRSRSTGRISGVGRRSGFRSISRYLRRRWRCPLGSPIVMQPTPPMATSGICGES